MHASVSCGQICEATFALRILQEWPEITLFFEDNESSVLPVLLRSIRSAVTETLRRSELGARDRYEMPAIKSGLIEHSMKYQSEGVECC